MYKIVKYRQIPVFYMKENTDWACIIYGTRML
jgi:hypothetical protein